MAISPVPLAVSTLLFPGRLRRIIERLAAVVYPHEVCGLLIGASDGNATFIEEVTHVQRLYHQPVGEPLELGLDDFRRAQHIAAENGLEVVGIWQSRTSDTAAPSRADLDAALSPTRLAATVPNHSYVTVSVAADRAPETRSWRLDGDHFVEETVQS